MSHCTDRSGARPASPARRGRLTRSLLIVALAPLLGALAAAPALAAPPRSGPTSTGSPTATATSAPTSARQAKQPKAAPSKKRAAAPDTVIDAGPPAMTNATSAEVTFHATLTPATFACRLDKAPAVSCASPASFSALGEGQHVLTVTATSAGRADSTPAVRTWVVDTTPPSAPTALSAKAAADGSVLVTWQPASDANGISGYQVLRSGTPAGTVTGSTFTDPAGSAGDSYTVRASDVAGNLSAASAPTLVAAAAPAAAPQLTRWPYLTDLVGSAAIVNFATDRSGSSASVKVGTPSGSTCAFTTTVPATRVSITVNSTGEYQWKAGLTGLTQPGPYCYRPFLGATDLLGSAASPQVRPQVPVGDPTPWSFAVFGDWGEVDATGANPNQANVLDQVAASGARFAVTTGDNSYPSGSQGNYGDLQQTGAATSAVFGPSFWAKVGATMPIFPVLGNHGLARSDATHPQLANWPQDTAVATSSGRYQKDSYPAVLNSAAASYPSAWYAFSAGTARFYLLDAAWADTNGTDPYGSDAASHWTPSSPEYQWLQADLQAHSAGLKFAFWHYPMFSDQPSEKSDTALQASLGALLSANGVTLGFSGHAHIYQRSTASGPVTFPTYVTGGGGGKAQSLGSCAANDAYAIGWSYTRSTGTPCGAAASPTSDAQIYHFLKVTVNGSSVTVTPTDSTGRTFDVQTYASTAPDTFLDARPPAASASTSATFTFHGVPATSTFTCTLDTAPLPACDPAGTTVSGLAAGSHTFTAAAVLNGVSDPQPAAYTWTVDPQAPTPPTGLTASATPSFGVDLSWTAATDNVAVTGYDVYRDGAKVASVGAVTSWSDTATAPSTSYSYTVRATDAAGNSSADSGPATVTTAAAGQPLFADSFETGTLSAWSSTAGLVVQSTTVSGGSFAAEGHPSAASAYAKKTLPSTLPDAWVRVMINRLAGPDQTNLLRLRDPGGASLAYVYIAASGQLGLRNDHLGTSSLSSVVPAPGWHALELHLRAATSSPGTDGALEVWLDGAPVGALSSGTVDTGTAPVGGLQIGEVQAGTFDVVYDDAAIGASRLAAADTSAPSVPAGLSASASSSTAVQVSWAASSDNVAVSGYDVLRDGTVVAGTAGTVTTFTDANLVPGATYGYSVRARDAAGNLSAASAPVSVTMPAATSVFADGFESQNLSAWSSATGLSVTTAPVRTGSYSVTSTSGAASNARKTIAAASDVYARVGVYVSSQTSQFTLLRLRPSGTTSTGFVYLTSSGKLSFRNDSAAAGVSGPTLAPGAWHTVELHLDLAGNTVEVWLDGALVPALSGTQASPLAGSPVTQVQLGDTAAGTYVASYDDVAVGTSRQGI